LPGGKAGLRTLKTLDNYDLLISRMALIELAWYLRDSSLCPDAAQR
jgi:hypothetical protein